ncbi:MAG TPA: DUF2520 domain-containing protein [Arenibacter sp.]|nr:DUF2520 domain-containing protein [Arenibacter sp.]
MISIVILGSGNVARHLFDVFLNRNGIDILQVWGRNAAHLSYFKDRAVTNGDCSELLEADLYIIAVSDDAIPEIARTLVNKKGLVVHTSGSVPLNALDSNNRRGVFYPLQTFSKGIKVNFKTVPICIEAETEEDRDLLHRLAGYVSDNVRETSSEQRRFLHIAAVFVNNFTNHLFQIGNEICGEHDLAFDILLPLVRETVRKLDYLNPLDAQTGPARRGDRKTMENHLHQLDNKIYKDIYALLSKSISEKYGQKL